MLMARTRRRDRPRNKDENHSSSTATAGWDEDWEVSANNEDIQNSRSNTKREADAE